MLGTASAPLLATPYYCDWQDCCTEIGCDCKDCSRCSTMWYDDGQTA